jgi:hypothetical protein
MIQVVAAKGVTLQTLKQNFGLKVAQNPDLFSEWIVENQPPLSDSEQQYLERVKSKFLGLPENVPMPENSVKMAALQPWQRS